VVALQIRRLDPDLPLPSYSEVGDAGADLVSSESVTIPAGGGRVLVGTGISFAIPMGFAGFVQPRSGMALRSGVTVLNTPGLVDAGYRNELKVILINTDPEEDYVIERGDRVAQLVIQRVEQIEWEVVDELPDSDRGMGGFGHSGR
jgi:dUTP pyrophosphatase